MREKQEKDTGRSVWTEDNKKTLRKDTRRNSQREEDKQTMKGRRNHSLKMRK